MNENAETFHNQSRVTAADTFKYAVQTVSDTGVTWYEHTDLVIAIMQAVAHDETTKVKIVEVNKLDNPPMAKAEAEPLNTPDVQSALLRTMTQVRNAAREGKILPTTRALINQKAPSCVIKGADKFTVITLGLLTDLHRGTEYCDDTESSLRKFQKMQDTVRRIEANQTYLREHGIEVMFEFDGDVPVVHIHNKINGVLPK